MAAELQDVMIGFKSGVVIKTSIEGGVKVIVNEISKGIESGPLAPKSYRCGKDGGYLFETKGVDFVVVVSGK